MRRTVYLFCVIVLFLTGCVAAPEKITVDGVEKAINQSEEAVVELKDGKSVETVLSSLPDDINTTIQGEDTTLVIAAKVQPPKVDTIYTAILQPIIYDEKKLVEFCFAEQAKDTIRDGSQEEYGSVQYYIPDAVTEIHNISLDLYNNGEIFYNNGALNAQYSKEVKAEQENAQNCSLSAEDAKRIAKDYLRGLGIPAIDITQVIAEVADSGAGKGFYSITFTVNYFDIPFYYRGVTVGMNPPGGSIVVAEEGIITLSGAILFEALNATPVDQILSLEDILSLIPEMMDTRIKTQSDTPVVGISLRYLIKADENNNPMLVPVWLFDIDQEAAKAVLGNQDEYVYRGSQDLIFNALTGQLER
ncbi:MAG TPA: hypothetical protein PKA81_13640 [Clostridia bacterium]|nr:hypothetical protein [Clostridia bacterium]